MSLIDWIYDNVVDVNSVGACPYHMSAGNPNLYINKYIFNKIDIFFHYCP